jgi:hypothetical protein
MEENENATNATYPREYGAIIPILELNEQIILELDLAVIEVIIQVSSYLKNLVISLIPNITKYYIDNNKSAYLERWAYKMMRRHRFDILSSLCNIAYNDYGLLIGHYLLDKLLYNYSTDTYSDASDVSKCYGSLEFIICDYNIAIEDFINLISNIENDNDRLFTLMRDVSMLISDGHLNLFPAIHHIIYEIRDNYDRQKHKLDRLNDGLISLKTVLDVIQD